MQDRLDSRIISGGGVKHFLRLDADMCDKYRLTLAEFYFSNMTSCSCVGEYTHDDADRKIGEMIAYIREEKAYVFGCLADGCLIGYLWSYPFDFRSERRLYVSELHVAETYRGQGVGSELLRMAERETADLGLGALYLHAEAANTGAIRLYEKMGYRPERIQLRKEKY